MSRRNRNDSMARAWAARLGVNTMRCAPDAVSIMMLVLWNDTVGIVNHWQALA